MTDEEITEATENSTPWHDLRVDPNDLPKEYNRDYYCYTEDGYKSVGVYKLAGDDTVRWDSMSQVIGWLDAPEFNGK